MSLKHVLLGTVGVLLQAWMGVSLRSRPEAFSRSRGLLQALNFTMNTTNGTANESSFDFLSTPAPFAVYNWTNTTQFVVTNISFQATPAPFTPVLTSAPPDTTAVQPFIPGQTVRDPILGDVVVRASQVFPLPDADVLASTGFSYALSDPAFSHVGVSIPPGAWPPNVRQPPTINIFDPPAFILAAFAESTTRKLAGPIVDFGPDGLIFLVRVLLSLPINASYPVPDRASYLVHVLDNSSWIPRPVINSSAANTSVFGETSAVFGETQSFSPYAALALRPEPPAETTPAPASTPRETYGPEAICSPGCIIGSVFATFFGVGLCVCGGLYLYKSKRSSDAQKPQHGRAGEEEEPRAPREAWGTSRDDAQAAAQQSKQEQPPPPQHQRQSDDTPFDLDVP